MAAFPNRQPFALSGRWRYRFSNIAILLWATARTTYWRILRGPLLPNWSWLFEMGTEFVRQQFRYAFRLADIRDGREYLDALVPYSPALEQVETRAVQEPVAGEWVSPLGVRREQVILHMHGGGFCYHPKSSKSLVALIALAGRMRAFSLDYRLAPEHSFPAQLEDALKAYDWLLESGFSPADIIVAGESSGGNLCLSLLLALRQRQKPQPALAICLSPWTDIGNFGESMTLNEPFDIIDKRECEKSAGWFAGQEKVDRPLISPLQADLRQLAPIYIQAGSKEIFIDMIEALARQAREQGAGVVLEVWENMNHAFQAYGDQVPESRQALARIGEIIDEVFKAKEVAGPIVEIPG